MRNSQSKIVHILYARMAKISASPLVRYFHNLRHRDRDYRQHLPRSPTERLGGMHTFQ